MQNNLKFLSQTRNPEDKFRDDQKALKRFRWALQLRSQRLTTIVALVQSLESAAKNQQAQETLGKATPLDKHKISQT